MLENLLNAFMDEVRAFFSFVECRPSTDGWLNLDFMMSVLLCGALNGDMIKFVNVYVTAFIMEYVAIFILPYSIHVS